MIKPLLIFLFLFSTHFYSFGQAALIKNMPRVSVTLTLLNNHFMSSDSVKFLMSIRNDSNVVQKFLFDKTGSKTYPWGTGGMIENTAGKSMILYGNKEVLSPQIYTEDMLETEHLYDSLQPGKSLSHMYYLGNIVIFKTENGKLPKGNYYFQLFYYDNLSNKVNFTID